MNLPSLSIENKELPQTHKKIEDSFDQILGPTWREKYPSTPSKETPRTPSIEDLLELLQNSADQLKPYQRLQLWLAIEKRHPATQANLRSFLQKLWTIAEKENDFSILYLMIQCFFSMIQGKDEEEQHPQSLDPSPKQEWTQSTLALYTNALLSSIVQSENKQKLLHVKNIQEWFQPSDELDECLEKAALRFHDSCRMKKTPQKRLEQMNLPPQGRFTEKVFAICQKNLINKPWTWPYTLWTFQVFEEQSRSRYIDLINQILEKTPDNILQNCKNEFFSHIRKDFGHPLSSESDWKFFSEQARKRVLSWGGKVQYEDYQRVYNLLEEVGYYKYISIIKQDYYGEGTRSKSRYDKYWRQYSGKMKLVRFYITPTAHDWLTKHTEGAEVIREIGLGQCIGQMATSSDVILMEFEPFSVLEFIYGSHNHALFFEKSVYQENQAIFLRSELLLAEVLRLQKLKTLGHPYKWQEECDKLMSRYGIYKDYEERGWRS